MKIFSKNLKKNAEEMKMIPLENEKNRSYFKQKACCICKTEFRIDDDNKKYHKVRDPVITLINIGVQLIMYVT